MARTGRAAILVTAGRWSGQPRKAGPGYHRRPNGSVVVAAGTTGRYAARLVEGDERSDVLAAFTEHLGGPARRAHWSEVFVLEPVDSGAA